MTDVKKKNVLAKIKLQYGKRTKQGTILSFDIK